MKKLSVVLLGVLLAGIAAASAFAVFYRAADERSGSVSAEVVNRVNFSFSQTAQVFSATDGEESYVAEVLFSASKTEPDFYAVIHSVSVSGMNADYVEIIPAEQSAYHVELNDAELPVENGTPVALSWIVRIYFHALGEEVYSPEMTVDYTSGVKQAAADRHLYTVPLQLTVKE